MAALAALAGLTDFLNDTRIRDLSAAWHHMIGNVVAVLLSLWNWCAATNKEIPLCFSRAFGDHKLTPGGV
jgi:uncharacterized membrane protein